jgi:hypothetical protein
MESIYEQGGLRMSKMEEKTLRKTVDLSIINDLGAAPSFCPYRDAEDLHMIALKKITVLMYHFERAKCLRPQSCERCFRENTELLIH